jgi:hypothetical protein
MATQDWTGLGLADGTVLSNGNLNTTGNGSGSLTFVSLAGGATRVTRQESNGNGVEIAGTTVGDLARLDTVAISGGAECMAVDFIYQAPATPATDHNTLIAGRNANATPGFSGYVEHTTGNRFEFKNASHVLATSAVSGSATSGQTPTLVAGDYYRVSAAFIRNTSTTPSTSNGRILGRVRAITTPTWNSSAEFWFDTGYTANVTVDKTSLFRTGKTGTAGTVGTFRLLNLRWRDLATPDTSLTKANAITNLVLDTGPTIDTTGTGAFYLIYAVGTPGSGGVLSYSITQTGGTTTTPTIVNPAAPATPNGVWKVVQSTAGALTYDVTVSETTGSPTTTTVTVPVATSLTAGQLRIRQQIAGVLT